MYPFSFRSPEFTDLMLASSFRLFARMSSMFGRVGRGRGMSNGEDLDGRVTFKTLNLCVDLDQRPFRNENDSRNYREGSTAREPYSGYGGARTDHQNDESRRDEGRFSNASRGGTRGRGAMSNTNGNNSSTNRI